MFSSRIIVPTRPLKLTFTGIRLGKSLFQRILLSIDRRIRKVPCKRGELIRNMSALNSERMIDGKPIHIRIGWSVRVGLIAKTKSVIEKEKTSKNTFRITAWSASQPYFGPPPFHSGSETEKIHAVCCTLFCRRLHFVACNRYAHTAERKNHRLSTRVGFINFSNVR